MSAQTIITFRTLCVLLVTAILSGCSGKHVDLEMQIDQVAQIQHQKTYPNQGATHWAVGQWALYKTSAISREGVFRLFDGNLTHGFVKLAITGQSGSSFWLEQQTVWPDQEQHIAALVLGTEQNPTISQVRYTRADGQTTAIDVADINDDEAKAALDSMQYLLHLLEFSHRSNRIRNISVPAGRFLAAQEVAISMSQLLGQIMGNVLYSQAIPVLHIVKSVTEHDDVIWFKKTVTWELVDFGTTDSNSLFTDSKM